MKRIRVLALCLGALCLAATGCIPIPVELSMQGSYYHRSYYTTPRTYYTNPPQRYYRPAPPPPRYVPYMPQRPVRVYGPPIQYGSRRARW
jgi:hypothetical protein